MLLDDKAFLEAVGHYIERHGGKAVMIGGVSVERDPLKRENQYTLRIDFTGRPPRKGDTSASK